jgi:hypothetical protein
MIAYSVRYGRPGIDNGNGTDPINPIDRREPHA